MHFDFKKYNDLNTTVAHFLVTAVLTAFTCGVILGLIMLCGVGLREELPSSWVSILEAWLMFLGSMWGFGVTQFGIKRKTHQPWGAQGEGIARPSTAVPAIPPSIPGV